jgi:Tfp pilus assembly protein PilF
MSLLLDALKRAELAKQRQQAADNEVTLPVTQRTDDLPPDAPEAGVPPAGAAPSPGGPAGRAPAEDTTRILPQEPSASAAQTLPPSPRPRGLEDTRSMETTQPRAGQETTQPPVITKDRLPNLDQPMDIVAEPRGSRPVGRSVGLELEETVPPSPASGTEADAGRPARSAAAAQPPRAARPWESPALERDAARQIFEVKQMDYNPRRPFYITLALLGVAALGTGGYFWYEMQPHSSFIAASSPPPAPPRPIASSAPPAGDNLASATGNAAGSVPAPGSPPAASSGGSMTAGSPPLDPLASASPTPSASPRPAPTAVEAAPAGSSAPGGAGAEVAGVARVQPSMGVVNPLVPAAPGAAGAAISTAPSSASARAAEMPATPAVQAPATVPIVPKAPVAAPNPPAAMQSQPMAMQTPPPVRPAVTPRPATQPRVLASASDTPTAVPTAPSAIPPAPSGIPTQRPAPRRTPSTDRPTASAPPAGPTPVRPEPTALAAAEPAQPTVQITPAEQRLDPNIEAAYVAFNAGKLDVAQQDYQRALANDSLNRDALLGLAAIDIRNHQYAGAEARYRRVLDLDPRDPLAQAGLLGVRNNGDPVQGESQIKTLLAQQPDAPVLQFALGNQYAAQSRWSEAQEAYFQAYAADPENPDFAFNLAVSLDQLRQPKPALDYYQRAIALAQKRPAAFDHDQAVARVGQLTRP